MNPPDVDLEEVIRRGKAAATLLKDESFVATMNDLSDYHLAALAATRPIPAEAEARDYHHLLLYALREIVSDLEGRRDVAEKAEAALSEPADGDNEETF